MKAISTAKGCENLFLHESVHSEENSILCKKMFMEYMTVAFSKYWLGIQCFKMQGLHRLFQRVPWKVAGKTEFITVMQLMDRTSEITYNHWGWGRGNECEPEIDRAEKPLICLETVFNYQKEQQYRSSLCCIYMFFSTER